MRVSESKQLEVWVAEDSPFYRLVVEEAIDEIAKVTSLQISLAVFERFSDIKSAFADVEQGRRVAPSAVLSDLHFPDNAHDDIQDIVSFYSRYVCQVPVSYMSCNSDSLELAKSLVERPTDALSTPRFLRKDSTETMMNLVKTIHAMVFAPRNQSLKAGTTLA